MTNTATRKYQVTVIERALAFYEVEAEDARSAAEKWSDGEFQRRDDEALDTEGPSSVRERQPDGAWRKVPESEWRAEPPPAGEGGLKRYSVLLFYPDWANDGGKETYYDWVEAPDPITAVAVAQRRALELNEWDDVDPADFAPLLVTEGHHRGEALFNK
jgi:hypothetical protein